MRTGRHFDTPAGQGDGLAAAGRHFAPAAAGVPGTCARAAVCTAGLSLALVLGGAPLAPTTAVADEPNVPDASWTPDVPSIDGSDVTPSPEPSTPDTAPDIDQGGDGDNGATDLPSDGSDTPSYVPSYDETYAGGDTSSYAASPAAFQDPSGTAADAAPAAEEAAPAAAPTITGWDASTRVVTGTAAAGATVQALDAQGTVVAQAQAGEDGAFALTLPEGVTLADVTIVSLDADGVASAAASGSVFAARQSATERSRVSAEVASAVAELAQDISGDVGQTGLGTGYARQESSSLPLMPYVLGAAAGVVGAGVAVAGVVALTRGRREQTSPAPVASATVAGGTPAASAAHAGDPAAPTATAFPAPSAAAPVPATPTAGPAPAAPADPIALALAELEGAPAADTSQPAPAAPLAAAPGSPAAARPDSTDAFLAVLAGSPAPTSAGEEPSAPAPSDTIAHLAPVTAVPAASGDASGQAPVSASDTAAFIALLGKDAPAGTANDDDDPRPPHGGAPASAPAADEALPAVSRTDLPDSAPAVTHDVSGLDAWSGELVAPAAEEGADPLCDAEDWRAVALAELAGDEPQPAPADGRDSTVSQTLPRAAAPAGSHAAYVAPVVGPASTSRVVSALRQSGRLEEVQAALAQAVEAHAAAKAASPAGLAGLPEVEPAGAPVPAQTAAFTPQQACPSPSEDLTAAATRPGFVPTARHFASDAARRLAPAAAPVPPAAAPVPAAAPDDGWDDGFDDAFFADASPSGVPQIQRGAARIAPAGVSCVVPDVDDDEFSDAPAAAWQAPVPVSGFGYAPVSPAQRLQASLAPAAASFGARTGWQPAYAPVPAPTYAYGYVPAAPMPQPAYVQPYPVAWAPAYVPAGAYQAPAPVPATSAPSLGSVPAVWGAGEELPATDAVTYADDVYATDTLSPEYISYLVEDEFAHRHDSPAQRAAAAGQLHLVMGSGAPKHAATGRAPGAKHFA